MFLGVPEGEDWHCQEPSSSKNVFNPSRAFDAVRPQYTFFKGCGKPENVAMWGIYMVLY